METKEIYYQVEQRYGSVDRTVTGKYEQTVAKAFGYTEAELAAIPEGANLGLSCGNPLAIAKLRNVSVHRTELLSLSMLISMNAG